MMMFLIWTLVLYWMHVIVHAVPVLRDIHMDHHMQVSYNRVGWHWSNLFLYNDSPKSTLDLWITEVLPTIVFCWVTGAWWIAVFYYVWAAFIQEHIEHDHTFDVPVLTSGRWHLHHHYFWNKNFGVFVPFWDYLFRTYAPTPGIK